MRSMIIRLMGSMFGLLLMGWRFWVILGLLKGRQFLTPHKKVRRKSLDENRKLHRSRFMACCFIGFLLPVCSLLAAGNYDVSYLWTTDQKAALAYARKVKRVLGPNATKKIKVVRSRRNQYGVIYDRNGDRQTAQKLARHHAQLLYKSGITKQSGISAACPIRDTGYGSKKQPKKKIAKSQKKKSV